VEPKAKDVEPKAKDVEPKAKLDAGKKAEGPNKDKGVEGSGKKDESQPENVKGEEDGKPNDITNNIIDGLSTIVNQGMAGVGQAITNAHEVNGQMKEHFDKYVDNRLKTTDTLYGQTKKDNEVLTEMAKIGAIFSRLA
ncbi:MAG: hypothetical protein AAFV29_19795, partial [Myxococcota bacterium]